MRAIVAGERDGASLARFRDPHVKADEATIARSLRGTWRDEHLFALEQALERHDLMERQIERAEARIDALVEMIAGRWTSRPRSCWSSRRARCANGAVN